MKTTIKSILTIGLLPLLLAACTADPAEELGTETSGKVTIRVSVPDYGAEWSSVGSRAIKPMDDEIQKKIHNLYYLYFNSEGILTNVEFEDIQPDLTHKYDMDIANDQEGTIYVVANSEKVHDPTDETDKIIPQDKVEYWPQSVKEFQQQALMRVFYGVDADTEQGIRPADVEKGLPSHMIMFGSYVGKMTGAPIDMILGRVIARMNINLSGEGLGPVANIKVENAAARTPLFPMAQLDPDNEEHWRTYEETITTGSGIEGTPGNYTASLYYYCGENDFTKTEKKTTLIIKTWDNAPTTTEASADRTYTIDLGSDSPNVPEENRDFSIYRNNSYTFNITLKNQ